jgi:sterol desaturase/sphingolipid hydroxylase (fatty acid hydroxylase superfamily)
MIQAYLAYLALLTAVPLILIPFERIAPAEPGQPGGRILFNLLYAPFIFIVGSVAMMLAAPVFQLAIGLSGGGLAPALGGLGGPILGPLLLALVYAFVWDFSQYWLHRLHHGSAFFWEMHRFHHEETALSAATYPRNHFLGMLAVVAFYLPVVVVLGAQTPHFLLYFLIFPVWGYFTHANLRIGFGRFSALLTSPQLHRIHHSARPEHRDHNFATLFPVIDVAFGTYYRPGPGEYPETGLGEPPVPNWRGATIEPFLAWWRAPTLGGAGQAERAAGVAMASEPLSTPPAALR